MNAIIHLISSPRNISTALMYSFANRGDLKVVDEPFYAFYLNQSSVYHPGKAEIIESQPTQFEAVLKQIEQLQISSTVFLKNMAQHIYNVDWEFLKQHKVVFLIRDPKPQIYSFSKVIEKPTDRDIGLLDQYNIFQFLKKQAVPFSVIDSNQLLKNPKVVLTELCNQIGIPFTEKMLGWPVGPIPEDGVWAKFWYDSVHTSTKWGNPKSTNFELPKHLEKLFQLVQPLYEELLTYAIKA